MHTRQRWIVVLTASGVLGGAFGMLAGRLTGDPSAAALPAAPATAPAAATGSSPSPSRGVDIQAAAGRPETTSTPSADPLVLDVTSRMLLTADEFPEKWADAWRELGTTALDGSSSPYPCARVAKADPDAADALLRRMFLDVPGAVDGYDGPSGSQAVLASRSTSAAEEAVRAIRADLRRCPTDPPAGMADARYSVEILRELPDLGAGGFIAQLTDLDLSTHFHLGVVRVGNLVTVVVVDDYAGGSDATVPSSRHMLRSLRTATARLGGG